MTRIVYHSPSGNIPVTSNVIGYIWEIQAICTNMFISAKTLYCPQTWLHATIYGDSDFY